MVDPELVKPDTIRGIKRVEYERMVELGMFADERVELLNGALVTMTGQSGAHAGIVEWLTARFIRALDETYRVRSHSDFAATDCSEPQPDVLISRGPKNLLVHPSSALLVIEVSDSSLRKDRRIKAPIYASSGVPEYWIVNISKDELVVEVHTQPTPSDYRRIDKHVAGDVLRPTQIPNIEIAVADIPWQQPTG